MGFKVILQGQDITQYVQEESILVKDVLGQGTGTFVHASGRSDTAEFVTTLGPQYTAVGAGTRVSSPTLVRMGNVTIYDTSVTPNVAIFGGYVGKLTDVEPVKTAQTRWVKVECYDYWQHLDRIMVNQVFDGQTDLQIISTLCATYASWLNLSRLPTAPAYQFGPRYFRNMSLQKALQAVCDVTGNIMWVDALKNLYYQQPSAAPVAPFSVSDTPNFVTSFPFQVTDVETDDTAAINRVFFFGGKVPSNDYTQDLSMFANGTNTTFPLAYYPRESSNGKIIVTVNGNSNLVVGSATGKTTGPVTKNFNPANNILKPQGNADVLVNYDAHTLIFAYPPGAGSTVFCTYRYEYPLVVTVPDYTSYQYWGMWLDGAISDNTVFDRQQAIQRARVLLLENTKGNRTVKFTCWKPGLLAGQVVRIDHSVRNIHDNLVIQEVDSKPRSNGGGNMQYEVTCGAWNWNFADVIKSAAAFAVPADSNTDENQGEVSVLDVHETITAAYSMLIPTTAQSGAPGKQAGGQFYARATALNDGHDAYPGFFSVTS